MSRQRKVRSFTDVVVKRKRRRRRKTIVLRSLEEGWMRATIGDKVAFLQFLNGFMPAVVLLKMGGAADSPSGIVKKGQRP